MEIYNDLMLAPMARQFTKFMDRLAGEPSIGLALAAAEVCRSAAGGDVCIDLGSLAGTRHPASGTADICFPDLDQWRRDLRRSGVVGAEGDFLPLILDRHDRLYLQRYWQYQEEVAAYINGLSRETVAIDYATLAAGLARLFPRNSKAGCDWQKVAAFAALHRKFCVITGGPGTGKTTTVAKILALLFEQFEAGTLAVALAAPTGKAVSRLQESLAVANAGLDCAEYIMMQLPDKAVTLHRLLAVGVNGEFRFNRDNPLPYDVVVVDEASMVALPMMARLVQAMRPGARLILLGDRDQLASVEAGAVLADICCRSCLPMFSADFCRKLADCGGDGLGAVDQAGPDTLHDSIVELRDSFRFAADSGIGVLSKAVRDADIDGGLDNLFTHGYEDALWRPVVIPAEFSSLLAERVADIAEFLPGAGSLAAALAGLNRLKFLCPLRHGLFGVEAVNAVIESHLRRTGAIPAGQDNYRGRPLMIVQNDYERELFNGDVGVVWPEEGDGGKLRAFFQKADGVHSVPLALLPPHGTVYAMTVHKSQGSEYDEVIVVLPPEPVAIITRELIYTAFTRVRRKIEVWGREDVLLTGVARRVERQSGLPVRLWGD